MMFDKNRCLLWYPVPNKPLGFPRNEHNPGTVTHLPMAWWMHASFAFVNYKCDGFEPNISPMGFFFFKKTYIPKTQTMPYYCITAHICSMDFSTCYQM